jgi:hypothetical protein
MLAYCVADSELLKSRKILDSERKSFCRVSCVFLAFRKWNDELESCAWRVYFQRWLSTLNLVIEFIICLGIRVMLSIVHSLPVYSRG